MNFASVSREAYTPSLLPNSREDVAKPNWHERHYSPQELGAIWGLSHDSIIRLVKNETGILKLCPPHRRGVRKRVTYRIPESVATKVYERCRNN
jgi:hypothetical protein